MTLRQDVPRAHERIAAAAEPHFAGDGTGHAMDHLWRVYRLGRRLATAEGADFEIVGAAALLHDLHRVRGEEFVHPGETLPTVRSILEEAGFPESKHEAVCHCVEHHEEYEFAADSAIEHEPTNEERVLRDADNLDALGAIGVARAITFGVQHDQRLYDPDRTIGETYDRTKRDNTVLQHMHEKLLRLPDAMETETGRALATERAAFVEQFVEAFEAEWRGEQ